jgi:uncharacterized protein (DUF2062 family)
MNVESGTERHNGRTRLERVGLLFRYRLMVPLKRSVHPPEYVARGVMIGLAWGLTPTIGVQMGLCFLTWMIAKRWFGWDFSVVIAMAWTWTTNVLTMFPAYYLFFVTGQFMLGRYDSVTDYGAFLSSWQQNVAHEDSMGYWEWVWTYSVMLAKGWGVPMLLGSLPWAALGGWLGYICSLRFVRRYRQIRQARAAAAGGRE